MDGQTAKRPFRCYERQRRWDTQRELLFYNQVAKPHFADFARTMTERLISEMTLKVLGFEKGRAFSEFRHIVIQDGSSFAIHDGLREVFPGRFKTVKPAAVELHTTMDLLCDAPTTVVLTPDTTNEQTFLPEPASLRDSVLLADRGYVDLHYLRRVQEAGGFFLIRAKAGMNPQVLEAFREDGKRLRSLRNKPLQTIHAKLPKRQRVELVVQGHVDGCPLCLRLIFSWNRRTKSFCSFLTNLPSQRYPLEVICRAYKWRWQVELLLKGEWGICLRRDNWVSVRYAKELNSGKSSATLQRADRHGILGQKSPHFQESL